MYSIELMINIEIFTPIVLSRNDYAFNHVYIYIGNFIGFSLSKFKSKNRYLLY